MKTLEIINIIIMLLLVVYSLYFVITALFLFKKRKKDSIVSDKYSHFTILIPARNEEEVIKDAIQSFKRQKYPKDNYEIVVVINNTTDNTLGVCNAEGVRSILCERKIKNKGDALKEAFDRLKKEKTDAYIIMDADNVVNDEFLGEMNKSLNEGTLVAKSSMDIKAKENTLVYSSYAIYFFIHSILYSFPRNNIGASCAINGTGIMIKKEVIDKYPEVMERAKKAMEALDIVPELVPIRGGTDGSRLSFMGLPCPNIFTGGYNFHGKYEFTVISYMELACKTIIEICKC